MDLQSQLPPPGFYLSTLRPARFWLFTDAPVFSERYSSNLNIVPLPGMNAPYVSQGYGGGRVWPIETKLNAWHKFLADDLNSSARDPGSNVYQEYLEIKAFIDENGPSPLMMLHRSDEDAVMVALQDFSSEIALQEDVLDAWQNNGVITIDRQLPSTIPVTMTLVEVPEYRVRFN